MTLKAPAPALVTFVTLCTTAPLPFVPDVSTPVTCTRAHSLPCTVVPMLIVTAPALGAAPSARNRVSRENADPVGAYSCVATCTHVSPHPDRVGAGAVPAGLRWLFTQARTSAFAAGVIDAVG